MVRACVAFKAHQGWAAATAVDCTGQALRPLAALRVQIVDPDNREVAEPYHVAGGWHGLERVPRPDDPQAVIERAQRAQAAGAITALEVLRDELAGGGWDWQRAVLLTRRGIVHDLEESLASHAHIHIAEGDAIRTALRRGFEALQIDWVPQDEKETSQTLAERVGSSAAKLDAALKDLKPDNAVSWSKEYRLLAMAAALHTAS